ncbi:MAG: protein kinase domain-containing protein [Gemmataceae bacterium]
MSTDSVACLLADLEKRQVLEAVQLEELKQEGCDCFPHARDLAEHLVERGWVAREQIDPLLLESIGPGSVLGSYQVLEPLGRGGMGKVYKARHGHLHRLAAVKILHAADDERAVRRFQREARAAARLAHPHVVAVYDFGVFGPLHYLIMEYVEGTDWQRLVEQVGPLPIWQACDYVRQAARGLHYLHTQGLVHRDIKPSNLMITASAAVVKILDLGLVHRYRFIESAPSQDAVTRAGDLLGSPDYLAPEQALDAQNVDPRADIYSLGCTLYFLLTGQAPFPEGSLGQKLLWHQSAEPRPVAQARDDMPDGLTEILRRMLAKNRDDRFSSAAEVADALQPFGEPRLRLHRPGLETDAPINTRTFPKREWLFLVIGWLLIGAAVSLGLSYSLFARPSRHASRSETVQPTTLVHAGPALPTLPPTATRPPTTTGGWVPLLNGHNLDGWESWLDKPRGGAAPLGRNQDPWQVFRVVQEDGQPALRISGEIPGALTTTRTYDNYHLKLEFKWGLLRWPPLEIGPRRGGLIYHGVEPLTAAEHFWMRGLEYAVIEGRCGGLELPPDGRLTVEVHGQLIGDFASAGQQPALIQAHPKGQRFVAPLAVAPRVLPRQRAEQPTGEWNTLEVFSVNGVIVHRLNGQVCLMATEARQWIGLENQAVQNGKIQLKSAGTEWFVRDMALRPLKQLPAEIASDWNERNPNGSSAKRNLTID